MRSLDVLARRLLDADGPWAVHSTFDRAVNLVAADGELLGIVEAVAGNGPATLVLATDVAVAPSPRDVEDRSNVCTQPPLRLGGVESIGDGQTWSARVKQGDTAALEGSTLRIGARLALDLAGACLWQPEPLVRRLSQGAIKRRLIRAAETGARHAPVGGLAPLLSRAVSIARGTDDATAASAHGDLVVRRAHQLLTDLLAAVRECRWSDASAPVRALSGLGPGLTPSGDDVLAGLALGLRGAWGNLPAPLARILAEAVVGRTTDVAAARVRHAAAGHPDERTHRLLAALVMDASEASLERAVHGLLRYGHSSGADTLVGVLTGTAVGLITPAESPLSGIRNPARPPSP